MKEYSVTGIALDDHYTDSFLKLLLKKEYPKNSSVSLKRSIVYKEILTTLLLFGKVYLSKPYWIDQLDQEKLEEFIEKDMMEWIPDEYYSEGLKSISILINNLDRLYKAQQTIPTISFQDELEDIYHYETELEINHSERQWDLLLSAKRIHYFAPVIEANLNHKKFDNTIMEYFFLEPQPWFLMPFLEGYFFEQSDVNAYKEWHRFNRSFMNTYTKGEYKERAIEEYAILGYDLSENEEKHINEILWEQSAVFDSSVSAMAAASFASNHSMPLKSVGSSKRGGIDETFGDEAYQLFRCQFKELRYPVVETLEDVIRLRNHPSLSSYRKVIFEYSNRLRTDIESERVKVFKEFKKDLSNSMRDIEKITKLARFTDYCFYISIPLAIIGVLVGLPLSDLFVIPATGAANVIAHSKRKSLDWLLFGAPKWY